MKKLDADKHYKGYLYISYIWVAIIVLMLFLTGCYGTYYISDAEYSDAREENASITYYNNQIYSGWNGGYYYYYGTPHYYPWYYYYSSCPPSHYTHTTHVIITRPVNRPNTHRPNIRTNNNTKVIVTPNRNTKVKTNTNYTRPNKTKIKTNRSNKSTNKTFNNRSNKTNNRKNTRNPR